ncbi:MAG: hypothetical protein GC189_05835 [Alphaproteobacteria bacterium]|nr:hypothetical protein [Alphaproteobacteria bacterium]
MAMPIRFFNIQDIELIDFAKLVRQLPRRPSWNPFSVQGQYVRAILESEQMLRDNGINSALRLAHFFGQGLVETNFLQAKAENLNYSADGLRRIFRRKFADDAEIESYARKPERIANRVYADRLGNGPESSGDGWRYRGRGFFQLTGKDNYQRYGELAGVDLVNDPELIERDLKMSLLVAAAFFDKTGLGEFADRNDVAGVSRGVNRGNPRSPTPAHGEAERIEWTTKALALVRDPAGLLTMPAGPQPDQPQTETPSSDLTIGSTGAAVQTLQRMLNALGYAVGVDDGIFGPGTRRAVLAFQDEHGLPATGVADQATRDAISKALDEAPATPADPTIPQTPAPEPPPGELPAPTPPSAQNPPLTQSRTIWGAILAAIAGLVGMVRTAFDQAASAFPVLQTPYGPFNTIWLLVALLLIGVGIVIYARIDDRRKKKR